ncbi:MAG: hypothetical protein HKN29_07035, partial [Rhodothermales bacterium]|nr:hypothetical protein [Rhodothermales bacterium]
IVLSTINLSSYQTSNNTKKKYLVACVPFWVVHNILVASVPGLVSDALSMSSGLLMLVRTVREERILAATDPA